MYNLFSDCNTIERIWVQIVVGRKIFKGMGSDGIYKYLLQLYLMLKHACVCYCQLYKLSYGIVNLVLLLYRSLMSVQIIVSYCSVVGLLGLCAKPILCSIRPIQSCVTACSILARCCVSQRLQ